MSNQFQQRYQRCFISAPFGVELGSLPELLEERGISWEWAKDEAGETQNAETGLANADFIIVVLNGTRADYRGIFDAGIAIGLRKPILLIQTKSRVLPIDFRWFSTVKTSLSNHDALPFLPNHLFIECKNWQAPVNAATLTVFTGKLHKFRVDFGILVAANGITGDANERTAAHAHLQSVFGRDGLKVIVVTRQEIEALRNTDDLEEVMRNKYGDCIMGAHRF
ncbi:MAG TPA: restriction endonuclease [Paraburkholderia sp.]